MSAPIKKVRADLLLVERGLAESRHKAQALIMAGQVLCGTAQVQKAGDRLPADAALALREQPRWVSRGGHKLDHALTELANHGLSAADKVCVDVGASTGGFTDCLLQRGARKVYAVDVGVAQLHSRLRDDPRVVVMDGTNARHLSADRFDEAIELVVVDASFIGIGKLAGAIASWLPRGGELVALIKPQFEAGKQVAAKARGVIRDPAERARAIDNALADLEACGFTIVAQCDSPIRGPKGNLERLVLCKRPAT